jgi:hypothetical protein
VADEAPYITETVAALSAREQLLYVIGAVAQQDAALENWLRYLFIQMATPTVAMHALPSQFTTLLETCRAMVKGAIARMPTEWHAAALSALGEAVVAHEGRNRVVHDLWVVDPDTEADSAFVQERYRRWDILPTANRKTLSDAWATLNALRRATARLASLVRAARQVGLVWGDATSEPDPVDLAMVQGRFRMLGNGICEVEP